MSLVSVSVIGLNPRSPEMASAATISGEVTNAWVFGLPSFLFEKLRLKECTIVFFSCFSDPTLDHWPIQGPQALVNILVPNYSKVLMNPSRSMVNLTNSEPGLIPNSATGFSPLATACATIDAALEMSS